MTNETPSEKLARKPRPLRAVAIGAAALVVIAGAAIGVPAAVHAMTPAPTPTAVFVPVASNGQVNAAPVVSDDQQEQANQQEAQLEADNAAKAKAAADALAAQQAAEQAAAEQAAKEAATKHAQSSSGSAAGAPGSRVPFVASTDPNNANGGDYEDPGTFCQSHSASGNPPVCD